MCVCGGGVSLFWSFLILFFFVSSTTHNLNEMLLWQATSFAAIFGSKPPASENTLSSSINSRAETTSRADSKDNKMIILKQKKNGYWQRISSYREEKKGFFTYIREFVSYHIVKFFSKKTAFFLKKQPRVSNFCTEHVYHTAALVNIFWFPFSNLLPQLSKTPE